jgi:hypothetical protein
MSNAFSISKNTATIDILLLNFKVTWSVNVEELCCDVHGNRTDLY